MMMGGGSFYSRSNPDPFYRERQAETLVKPQTHQVIKAYVDDVYNGVGSWEADKRVEQIEEIDKAGEPISFELFKDMGYKTKWYPGVTQGGAEALEAWEAEQEQGNIIRSRASTAQTVAGFTAALGAGVFEPKNVAYGVAGSVVATPLYGAAASAVRSVRNARNIIQRGRSLGQIAGRGAMDGFVGAAMMEPSNRYAADVLQQDYTMADSMFNMATSALFGAAFGAVPDYVRTRYGEYRNKNKAQDVLLDEFETATTQLVTGKPIDIRAVEHGNSIRPIKSADDVFSYIEDNRPMLNRDNPELVKAYETIQAQRAEVKAIEQQVAELQVQSEVDPLSAPEVAEIDKQLAEAVTPKKRTQLEAKRTKVIAKEQERIESVKAAKVEAEKQLSVTNKVIADDVQKISDDVIKQIEASKALVQKHVDSVVDVMNDTALATNQREMLKEPSDYKEFYNKQFDSYINELDDDMLAQLNDALDSYNEADIEDAYNNAYACLTRGL